MQLSLRPVCGVIWEMFRSGKEVMPRLKAATILVVVVISFDILIGSAWAEELVYRTSPMKLSGEVCKPIGKGPYMGF